MAVGSVVSFGSVVVVRIASVVNSVILVRTLGLSNLGIYSILGLTISMATLVASFGVPQAIVKFLAEVPPQRQQETSRILGAGIVVTLIATSLVSATLALLSPVMASVYGESQMISLLQIAIVGLILNSFLSPAAATFQAFELFRELGVRNMVSAVLSVPITVILVSTLGLRGAVISTAASSAMAIAINLSLLRGIWKRRKLSLVVPRDAIVYRRILGYSVPALAGSMLVAPVLWFTNSYLATQVSFTEVGVYSVGYALASYLFFIPSAIGVPLVPIVSRLENSKTDELTPFLVKTLRLSAFLLIPATLLLIAFPEVFLSFLYGPESLSAGSVVRVLAPAVFFGGVSSIVGFAMAGKGRMWEGLVLNLSWAVVLVAGALFLVPSRSAVGLSFAFFAAYVVHFAGVIAYVRYAWSMDVRPIAVPIMIAVVSFAAAAGLSALLADPWRIPLMGLLIIAVVILELNTVSRRELEVLREPLKKLILWIGFSP